MAVASEGDALLNDSTVSADDEFFDATEASFLDSSLNDDEQEYTQACATEQGHSEQRPPRALALPPPSPQAADRKGARSEILRNSHGNGAKCVELSPATSVPGVAAQQRPSEVNTANGAVALGDGGRPKAAPATRTSSSATKHCIPSLSSVGSSWATRACALGTTSSVGSSGGCWRPFGSSAGSEEADSPGTSRAGSAAGGRVSSFSTGHASSGRPLVKQYSFRSSSRSLRAAGAESPASDAPAPLQPHSQPQKVYSDTGEPLTWAQVIYCWQCDDDFCEAFTDTLRAVPFRDYFWETVPVSAGTAREQAFEFVFIDAHGALDSNSGNPRLFLHSTFQGQDSNKVEAFYSSSQRVMIVTPCQNGRADDYSHLAAFVRRAPSAQVRELWRKLGQSIEAHLTATAESGAGGAALRTPPPSNKRAKPLWVSSNGVGVPWLHIRLDTAPKFYNHALWKMAPEKLRSMGVSPVSEMSSRQQSPFLAVCSSGGAQLKHRPLARISQNHTEGSEGGSMGSPLRMHELGEEGASVQEADASISLDDSRSMSSLTDDLYACSENSDSFFRGCFSCGLFRRHRLPCFRRTKSRHKKAASKDHLGAYTPCPHMAARRRDLLALAH